jgi:uncharacterized integral membrane protein (TIGR00698 family)
VHADAADGNHAGLLPAALLLAGGAASLLPFVSPAGALALGAAVGLTIGNPHRVRTQRFAGRLLQACVVGLGFGMSFSAVMGVGARGVLYTSVVVIGVLTIGLALGRLFRLDREVSLLIASGTGICGGSAIAAVGSAIRARGETMSVALAVVFVLNAVALYAFPGIGRLLELTQAQFAVWAALAIHDTSSVVGAATIYGEQALQQATVLKLARALWILPLALAAAIHTRRASHAAGPGGRAPAAAARIAVPWFILLFVLAAVLRSASPAAALPAFDTVSATARATLPVVLFLIGSGLTRTTLRTVGPRPMVQATLLWLLVASATLTFVLLVPGA